MGAQQTTNAKFQTYWKVKNKIGEGNFATVWRCARRHDKFAAAVKILRKRENEKEVLARETEILRTVNHPNCVRLLDVYETPNSLYLVTEICYGGEVFTAISNRMMSELDAAQIVRQITDALIYLHGLGIVHRDLKPENILYATQSRRVVKLLDFGFARVLEGDCEPISERSGTLNYTAPEVFSEKYDHRCDYWSLGVVLYSMICGYLPFAHEDRRMTTQLILQGRYYLNEDCSSEAKDLVKELLTVDPEKRLIGSDVILHPFIAGRVVSTPRLRRSGRSFERSGVEATVELQMRAWIHKAEKSLRQKKEEELDDWTFHSFMNGSEDEDANLEWGGATLI